MKNPVARTLLLALLTLPCCGPSAAEAPDPDPARFQSQIDAFGGWDRKNSSPAQPALFVGSSSIRLWPTAQHFPRLPVVNRGFGGAHVSDVDFYYDRVVKTYRPAVVVFYAGDNDVAAGKSPRQVFADFEALARRLERDLPAARLLYLPIKPSLSRWAHWPAMAEVNTLIESYARTRSGVEVVDVATPMLGEDGTPRAELFVDDGLHLNEKGYELWSSILRPRLSAAYEKAVQPSPAPQAPAIDERIARIERSLVPPLQLEGEPVPSRDLGEAMARDGVPAMALAIVDDCSVTWAGGWGALEEERAVTGATPFQAGSVSKTLTAAVAMILVAEGELDLDRPVNDLLRTFRLPGEDAARGGPVLVRHLLSHSAGLTRTAYGFERGEALPSLPDLLRGAAGKPAIVVEEPPGSRAVPSNSGYLLLQNLLEDVTGMPLARLAEQRLFLPLGMSASAFEPVDEAFLARAAGGHRSDGTAIEGKAPLVPAGPGGLWSSAEDLGRLLAELMKSWQGRSERLLPRAATRSMLSRQVGDMGLGVHLRGEGMSLSFQQAGGGVGSQARLVAYPELCRGAAVVINSDRGRRLLVETLAAVGREYGWPDLPLKRAKAPLDAEGLERLAGRYEYDAAPGNFLSFFVEGSDLFARARRDPFPVFPVSETLVVAPLNSSEMRFELDAEGKAVGVTIGTAGLYGSHLRRVPGEEEK